MFATEWIMRHEAKRLRRPMRQAELQLLTQALTSAQRPSEVYWIYRLLLRSHANCDEA